jgi:DegV family protein with EDD domain
MAEQRRVAVVSDSTADVPPDLAGMRGVTIVPLTVTIDGQSYLDGVEIDPATFYVRLASPGASATTSQPSPGRFAETYERLLADHEEVVSLHISSKMSGTYAAAVQGAEMAGGRRVRVLDTGFVSMPLGLLVLVASAMAAEGEAAEGIVQRLRPIQQGMRVSFMVATLEHLRRGGRIGRASALVGSVLQVKPVLTITEGQVAPLERVRTHEKALSRVVELANELPGQVCAFVGHAAAEEAAGRIAEALEPKAETLIVGPLGPVVGAHAGPGTVGVGCYPADLFPMGIKVAGAGAAP